MIALTGIPVIDTPRLRLRGPEAAAGLKAFARKQPAPWVEGGA